MSTENNKRLDFIAKIVAIVMLPIIGFFLIRLVNLVDNTVDRQQKLEIMLTGAVKDIEELKKFQDRSLNMFVDYFNRKDREQDLKELKESKK